MVLHCLAWCSPNVISLPVVRLNVPWRVQDIKPSNFLLKEPAGTQPQLEIRVVDFGCSQRIQAVRLDSELITKQPIGPTDWHAGCNNAS